MKKKPVDLKMVTVANVRAIPETAKAVRREAKRAKLSISAYLLACRDRVAEMFEPGKV